MALTTLPGYNSLPTYTTTQRNTLMGLKVGFTIYNSTSNQIQSWNGTVWEDKGGIAGTGDAGCIPLFASSSVVSNSILTQLGALGYISQNNQTPQRIQTVVELNCKDYGAKPDAKLFDGLATTSGSAVVVGPTGTFDSTTDVGKHIKLYGANAVNVSGVSFLSASGANSAGNYTFTGTVSGNFTADDVGKFLAIAGAGIGGSTLYTPIVQYISATQVGVAGKAQANATGATLYRDLSGTISSITAAQTTTATLSFNALFTGKVSGTFWATDNTTYIQAALNAALTSDLPTTVKVLAGTYHFDSVLSLTGLDSSDKVSLVGEPGAIFDFTDVAVGSGSLMTFSGSRTLLGTTSDSLNADVNPGNSSIDLNLTSIYDLKPGDLIFLTSYDKAQSFLTGGTSAVVSGATTTGCTVTLVGNPVAWQTVPAAASPALGATVVADDGPANLPFGSFITANNGAGVLTISAPLDATGNPIPVPQTGANGGFANGTTNIYVADGSLMFNEKRPEYNQGEFAVVEKVTGTTAPFKVYLRNHIYGIYKATSSWNGSRVYRVEAPSVRISGLEIRHDNIQTSGSGCKGIEIDYARSWELSEMTMRGSFDRCLYPVRCYDGVVKYCRTGTFQAAKSSVYGLAITSCQNFTVIGCDLVCARRALDLVGWEPVRDGRFFANNFDTTHYADLNGQNDGMYACAMHGITQDITFVGNKMNGIGFENAAGLKIIGNDITNSVGPGIQMFCMEVQKRMPNGDNINDLLVEGNRIRTHITQNGAAFCPAIYINPYTAMNENLNSAIFSNNQIHADSHGFCFQPSQWASIGVSFKDFQVNGGNILCSSAPGSTNNAICFFFNNIPSSSSGGTIQAGPVFQFKHFQVNGGSYETLDDSRFWVMTSHAVEMSGKLSIRGARMACARNAAGSNFFLVDGFTKISIIDSDMFATVTSLINGFTIGNLSTAASDVKDCFVEIRGCNFSNFSTTCGVAYGTSYPYSSGATAHLATAVDVLYKDNHHTLVTGTVSVPAAGSRILSEVVNTSVSGVPNVVGYGTAAPTTGTWQLGDRYYKSNATGVSASVNFWVYNGSAWVAVNFA